MCPIVPILICGLLRSNFSFAMRISPFGGRRPSPSFRYLSLDLVDDLFGETARHLFIPSEVHRETAAPLCPRAQFGCVSEHLRERDHRFDDLRRAAQLHALDAA